MITGLLKLRVHSPLTTPVTTPSVAGWLFAARFWSRPGEARIELDRLEANGTLALAAFYQPGLIPRPAVPILASGSPSKILAKASRLKWDLKDPLRPLNDGDADLVDGGGGDRPFLRPRLKMDRALGTVSEEQGFFHVNGIHTEPLLTLLIQTDLWDAGTLKALCAICSELGFGGRKSQGWGHVELDFEEGPLPLLGQARSVTHLLSFGDAWPGASGPAAGSLIHTRVHRGAGQHGPFKPPVLVMAPGSLLPWASLAHGWQVVGSVLRAAGSPDGVRALLCPQSLAWPVQVDLPVEVIRAAG
jgi:hypothetical protein